jgi:tripartite-type tricarboxylate transporter receptor subunit TctC
MKTKLIAVGACLFEALSRAPESLAQDWPTRPVTLVAPFSAGGPADTMARILAPRLSELLGVQVIVENIGGAGGMVGTARVAKAAPDGYQFVIGSVGTHAHSQSLYRKPLYDAAADFAPVALIADTPIALVARKGLPVVTLQEFASYAKAYQTKMQYGSGGSGSPGHLACALLNTAIGVSIVHVPYRGGGPALQDMIAGRIDYQCLSTSVARPQIESETIKAIAILGPHRSQAIPNLVSSSEQGLPNLDAGIWQAFFFPRGTSPEIVRRLHRATVATLRTPSIRTKLADLGAIIVAPDRQSPEYLDRFVRNEVKKWAATIKAANIRLN